MFAFAFLALSTPVFAADPPKPAHPPSNNRVKPLKVFILAGQSNMQGHASRSTLDSMADDPTTAPLLKEMLGPDGGPRVCENVWISSVGCAGDAWSDVIEQKGRLTIGFGPGKEKFGPEYTFGITMEKQLGEPILLIKTAWGGRSLHTDFRPPSAGPEKFNDFIVGQWKKRGLNVEEESAKINKNVGVFYRHMIEHVRKVLGDIKRVMPDYDPRQGYELAGFVWFQGFNDMIDDWTYPNRMKPGGYDQYAELLRQFIHDLRKDLKAPKMPFVIGVMGIGGEKEGKKAPQLYFRQAQAAPASLPEFRGNVVAVQTARFWDDDLDTLQQRWERFESKMNEEAKKNPNRTRPAKEEARKKALAENFTPDELKRLKGVSNGGYHYLGAAKIMAPIGKAFADSMMNLLTQPTPERKENEPAKPSSRTERNIRGWTVRIDDRLLKEPKDDLGKRALRFLENKLADIQAVVPTDKVKQLQEVTIVLDLSHGKLTSMQYHPSSDWLKKNGYSFDLAKCVHIPRAADLPTKRNINEQPWVILHELAHAYHDQVLGFEEPRIKEAYEKYRKSGHGDKTLLYDGRDVRHYALTNQMEFFAEMTEAYFGVNDFFPFNRAELKKAEPEIYILLKDVWETQPPRPEPKPRPTLYQQFLKENAAALAKAAREKGDASRGAFVFHRPELLCTRCHTAGEEMGKLGPDLAKAGKEATDVYLVESVLLPSKFIKKGFESITITTTSGKVLSGLLAEDRADAVVLRDANQDGKLLTILKKDIDERHNNPLSLMPEGLVNVLSSRQEFLDLTRYLIEIAEHGPERARQLRPAASLFAPPPLPEYERDLDHAGLIRALDAKSFKRGEEIYGRVCANCHGTKELVGSMPTSLRFAEGKFKNGSDPLRMYQTLTHGFGMMTPQTWMVPQQKYDVIHYIREAYLKPHNPASYTKIDDAYLATLPAGKSRGPKPSNIEPWVSMNYGPSLMATLEVGNKGNFAYKGISVRLDNGPGGVSRGRHWMLFDHDTMRVAAAWSCEGFIDWKGINFNGQHQIHPRVVGSVRFANPVGPGWANPETGTFDDPRLKGRDGKPYGPLPRSWARYKGTYHYGNHVILSYTVGTAPVLEMPAYELAPGDKVVFTRTLNVGKSPNDLLLRVAPTGVGVACIGQGAMLDKEDGFTRLRIPAKATPLAVKLLLFDGEPEAYRDFINSSPPPASLEPFTKGGPPRWPEVLKTQAVVGADMQAFAVDVLTYPVNNPWNCLLRLTGFDFFADGKRAAVCSWDGDVWLVGGIDAPANGLTWQRIASGLFQPLGLKIIKDKVYVSCRDQIVILHDLNGDGETDFYECFNNDHQVTEHFHEFAMDLQTDAEGNFYYAKAARHALKAVVPQHGTLLKVSKDGTKTEILATGFRAPNGVCVNPDGTFFLTDQEGFWVPKNRIDLVERGGYYGNFWGYHDVTDPSDAAMKQPLVWITNAFDRSPSELLWVTSDRWGPLKGSLLNFSYGYGKVYVVPFEKVNGQVQGGMCELPLPQFPTGVMRGRFHPSNGQLYCCGMFAWAGNQTQPGGFYRIRYTGKPVYVPIGLKATKAGMVITFSGALDPKTAGDPKNFTVQTWSLKRSAQYGSKHYDEKPLKVTAARVSPDGKTVTLEIEDLKATWCMGIKYSIKAMDGSVVHGILHNTIHRLSE
jgi:putative heme-binding domain-containing protein